MTSPDNPGHRDSNGHLSSPKKLQYQECELLAKSSQGNPQTSQAVSKAIDCFQQTDDKDPLRKITPAQFAEHREVEAVPA